MTHLRFWGLMGVSAAMMYVVWNILLLVAEYVFGFIGLSPNTVTAGAYAMETIVSIIAFILIVWRMTWAVAQTNTFSDAMLLLQTKAALFAMSIGGIIAVGFNNRMFWAFKHFGPTITYNHVNYVATINSFASATLICLVVHSINHTKDHDHYDISAIRLWWIGIIFFVLGSSYYSLI